ncbi:hypothetical protein, partial [Cyclobacterium xiamenense]|uniref:hypothetical protein n=1 Tax=Cyclobacterium xiamenense TaxID=1297121 RepID=UPI001387360F
LVIPLGLPEAALWLPFFGINFSPSPESCKNKKKLAPKNKFSVLVIPLGLPEAALWLPFFGINFSPSPESCKNKKNLLRRTSFLFW